MTVRSSFLEPERSPSIITLDGLDFYSSASLANPLPSISEPLYVTKGAPTVSGHIKQASLLHAMAEK